MKNYIRVEDLASPQDFVRQAMTWKGENNKHIPKAAGRALGMVFFNPSLRTRLSSLRAAQLLGLDTFDQNVASGWPLEFDPTAVMNQGTSEHIEEAAAVLSQYCDLLAIRAFPKLDSRDEDYREPIMSSFTQFAQVPIVNLESATRHPLQGLADMLTIEE
nr:acetylornithine carbamoyltransferase [Saprospiraceae bacterium]